MNALSRKQTWGIWVALLVFYLFMGMYIMPQADKSIRSMALDAECAQVLDLKVGMAVSEVATSLACMGPAAIRLYLKIVKLYDSIYLVAYGLFFAFTLFCLGNKYLKRREVIYTLSCLPILIALFDVLENRTIFQVITQFPHLDEGTVYQLSFFNQAKWYTFFVVLALLVGLLIRACYVGLSSRDRRHR